MPKTPRELLVQATSGQDPMSRYYTFPAPAVQPGQGIKGIFAEAGAGIKSVFEQKQKYLDELKKKAEELELKERQWQEEIKKAMISKGINPETGKPFTKQLKQIDVGNATILIDPETGEEVTRYTKGALPPQTFNYRYIHEGMGSGATTGGARMADRKNLSYQYALAGEMALSTAFDRAEGKLTKTTQSTEPAQDLNKIYELLELGLRGQIPEATIPSRVKNSLLGIINKKEKKGYISLGKKNAMKKEDYFNLLYNTAARIYNEAKHWQNVQALGMGVPMEYLRPAPVFNKLVSPQTSAFAQSTQLLFPLGQSSMSELPPQPSTPQSPAQIKTGVLTPKGIPQLGNVTAEEAIQLWNNGARHPVLNDIVQMYNGDMQKVYNHLKMLEEK